MNVVSTADDLAAFDSHNSPEGLFMRYANGRLRHFWNRQVPGLLGAIMVGLVISVPVGLAVAGMILAGEAFDCWLLKFVIRQVRTQGLTMPLKFRAVLGAGVQMVSLIGALTLCDLASTSAEMDFFVAAYLTSATLNAGMVRPYFRAGTDTKLVIAGIGALVTLVDLAVNPHISAEGTFLLGSAILMLFLMVMMFVRQIETSFERRQKLERSMSERAAELRRSREELAQSGLLNQRLAMAARHANDAIIFLDRDHRYEWVNEAFSRITGFSAEQAIGNRPGDLLNAAETSGETLAQLDAARRDQAPVRVEIFNRTKDGRGYWVDTSIIPIADEHGQLMVSLAIERDITEAKQREADLARAREAAEAAAKAKSRFLANMSHEIRTPMNGVIGVAELLADTRMSALQRDYVGTILESGRALLTMINEILDLSKLQSGTIPTEAKPFDAHSTVTSVLRLLQPTAQAKSLKLSLRLDPDLGPGWAQVCGDQGKLRQIMVNLIGNALKFTESGGVEVSIERIGHAFKFRVADTGIGIHPDRISSIFDSFTQADDSISRRFGGTGLGLTISAMLAQQMGGAIEVKSVAGTGSCFTLTLPLPPAEAAGDLTGAAGSTALPGLAAHQGLRLLVAEDNRTNMMILRKILKGQVTELIEAEDGLIAVQCWKEQAPDLILMDVSMPVMDGLTAAREIRALEAALRRPRCPILALTASSHLEDREACIRAGFDGFLVKPLRREELFQAISDQLTGQDPQAEPLRA